MPVTHNVGTRISWNNRPPASIRPEVAKHWYTQFIPELKEIAEKNLHSPDAAKVEGAKKLAAALMEHLAKPEHRWYTGQIPAEEKEQRKKDMESLKLRFYK